MLSNRYRIAHFEMYTHVYNLTHDFHDVVKTDKTLNDTEWQLITTTQFYIKTIQKI